MKSIPISEAIKAADENQRWAYTREQRLSYNVEIDPDSVVKGQWRSLEAHNEICIEDNARLHRGEEREVHLRDGGAVRVG